MFLRIALLSLALTSSALAETAPETAPVAEPIPVEPPAPVEQMVPAKIAATAAAAPNESPATPSIAEPPAEPAPLPSPTNPPAPTPPLPTNRLLAFIADRANHGTYVADECVCEGDLDATLCGDGAFFSVFFSLSAPSEAGPSPLAETVVLRNDSGELAFSPLAIQRASATLADTMPEEAAARFPELREILTTFELARGVSEEALISDSQGKTIFRGRTLTHVQAGFSLSLDERGAVLYSLYQSQRGSYDALPAGLREMLARESAAANTAGRVTCRMSKM